MARYLTPQQEAQLDRVVAIGNHQNADEVLNAALELIEERERLKQALRDELQRALEQESRGELIDVTPGYFEDVQRRALEAVKQGKPIRDAVRP